MSHTHTKKKKIVYTLLASEAKILQSINEISMLKISKQAHDSGDF